MPRYRLIVSDWGNVSGPDGEFKSFEDLNKTIVEACEMNGWPVPELIENPPGNDPGVYEHTENGLHCIAIPIITITCDACGEEIRIMSDTQEGMFACWRSGGYVGPVRQDCLTCRDSNSCNWHPRGEVLCYQCWDKRAP